LRLASESDDVLLGFNARTRQILLLAYIDLELHIHRRFDARSGWFPIRLQGVSIANEEQSAWMIDGQHHDGIFTDLVVIEITSIRTRWLGGRSKFSCRGHTDASEHWFCRKLKFDDVAHGLLQLNRSAVEVKFPWNEAGISRQYEVFLIVGRIETFDRFRRQRKQTEPIGRKP